MRRHHNNKGYRQIKTGKCVLFIERLSKKLNIPLKKENNGQDRIPPVC